MRKRIMRGRVLSFHAKPKGVGDTDSFSFFEDGAILIEEGRIRAVGDFDTVKPQGEPVDIIDHRPHLILPGFIDTHNHLPQLQVIGSYGAQLLDWLNTYTFPAESEFSDKDHAERIASAYFDEMLRNGTTTTVAYCSSHKVSADAYFAEAQRRGLCAIGGKVMMDRNAPDAVLDTAQSGYDDSEKLIQTWHGTDRLHYAISPRFAITSTPEQMSASQALVAEFPDCFVQTHLSENLTEIQATIDLYKDHSDYLSIYEHYGLLGEKSLFGHAIHLSERERAALSESGSVAVFCPTSNLFIGSGLFDLVKSDQFNMRVSVATDIGGGTSCSMLRTMDEAYKILQLQNQNLDPLTSFYMMTRGNADALGLTQEIGTLEPESYADLCILDSHATPGMALRMERCASLSEELFILQTMGDDRSVVETYVAGRPGKPKDGSVNR